MAAFRGHGGAKKMRWETGDMRREICVSILLASFLAACAPTYVPPTQTAPVSIPASAPVTTPVVVAPPSRPTEGEIDTGAGTLWYRVSGRGSDTVLVPLGAWLEKSLESLTTKHTVVFYDPRHRGRSHPYTDSTAETFDGDIADLEAVRAALGASRVSVIGYDYYAAVAAAWAAANPQRVTRLVLLSPIEPADSLARSWNPPERMARLDTTAARALVKARAAGRDTADAAGYCIEFWRVN